MKHLLLFLCFPALLSGQLDTITQILTTHLDHEGLSPVHSLLLRVDRVGEDAPFETAVGWQNREGQPLQASHQFRIASITKTFVATVVLQLVEEKKIKLTDRIVDLLPNHDFLAIDSLHYHQRQNFAAEISIEQLLCHRSGLADLFTDRATEFFASVFSNPNRSYTPNSIFQLYLEYDLHLAAHFRPGEAFAYSDMNYVVLGLLIEELEGQPLAIVLRNRILGPLELTSTYFEFYEKAPNEPNLLHQWFDDQNMSEINTSFDWAGGGLVSNMKDLSTFLSALFKGRLLRPTSLERMIQISPTSPHEDSYGLGIYASNFNGDLYFGHFGFYGSYMGYCPQKKQSIIYNVSQGNPSFPVKNLIEQILLLIDKD
ncbi:MAG: beta-lactamase family protein [Saprospiraceae bacterium]|nr:beta-lactamase family protein [Saprospiraceae bacterium]